MAAGGKAKSGAAKKSASRADKNNGWKLSKTSMQKQRRERSEVEIQGRSSVFSEMWRRRHTGPSDEVDLSETGGIPPYQAGVREAAAVATGEQGPILRHLKARRPWCRNVTGPATSYPLRPTEFWAQHLAMQAVVLRRGPLHPLPLSLGRSIALRRAHRLGVNAALPGNVRPGGRPKGYGAELGEPAEKAFVNGWLVQLERLEQKQPRLLHLDSFLTKLGRAAPGRGTSVSLLWAPDQQPACLQQSLWHDQLVVQLHGARRWFICQRGVTATAIAQAQRVGFRQAGLRREPCESVVLRRGDALYMPSRVFHWAAVGPGVSAHLVWTFLPLLAVDFIASAGAKDRLLSGNAPLLGAPLPLWSHSSFYDSVVDVAAMCRGLPWLQPTRDQSGFCREQFVEYTLQRLASFFKVKDLVRGRRPAAPRPFEGTKFVQNSTMARPEKKTKRWTVWQMLGMITLTWILFISAVCAFAYMVVDPRRPISISTLKKDD